MKNIFAPTVLLMDKAADGETTTTNIWLQRRGYKVKQVECLTDVIDSTIDFTLEARPSLILLNCGQIADVCVEKLSLLKEITDMKNLPLVALVTSKENFIGDKIPTIENLEALQPVVFNMLADSYPKAA